MSEGSSLRLIPPRVIRWAGTGEPGADRGAFYGRLAAFGERGRVCDAGTWFRVLMLLASAPRGWGMDLEGIAARESLKPGAKPRLERLLKRLVQEGSVWQDPRTGRYHYPRPSCGFCGDGGGSHPPPET